MPNKITSHTFLLKDRFSKAGRKIHDSLKRIGKGFRDVQRSSDKANKSAKRSLSTFSKLKKVGSKAFGALGLAGLGSALAVRSSVGNFATLERSVLNVLSNVTDKADKARLGPVFEKMISDAGELGISVEEAGRALFDQVSQSGFGEQSLKNYSGAMKLAIGGNADFADSVSIINKLLENFPELAGDADKAASFLFSGQVKGSTNVQQLSHALPEIAGSAANFGLSAAQTIGSVSLSTKRLGGTASGSIAFQRFIDTFQQTRGSAQFKALRKAGLPTNAVEFQKNGGLQPVLEQIASLRKTDRGKLLLSNAFTEVRAQKFLNIIDDKFVTEVAGLGDEMQKNFDLGIGLQDSFDDIAASTSIAMASTKEAFNDITIQLGKKASPAVKRFADVMNAAAGDAEERRLAGKKSFLTALNHFITPATAQGIEQANVFHSLLQRISMNQLDKHLNSGPVAKVAIEVGAMPGSVVGRVSSESEGGLETGIQQR